MSNATASSTTSSTRLPRAGLPLVGALPSLVKHPLEFLVSARERHGDMHWLDLGVTRLISLNHPRHAQHVLRDRVQNYSKGGPMWDTIRRLIGNGLPASEGDFWLRQRRMIQPQFHRERLAALTTLMGQAIDERLERWERLASAGEPLQLASEMDRITLNVAVKTMFGAGIESSEEDVISREMDHVLDYMLLGVFTGMLPSWVPLPGRQHFEQGVRAIDEIVFRVIERRRQNEGTNGDLIGMLLDMVDAETGERMTDQQLRDEAVPLFMAGYETTATGLSFTLALLAERPELAQAVREECETVLGGRPPQFTDLPRLKLALMAFQEALRLFPPAFWIPRTAVEDDVIDGYQVPAGTMVGIMSYAMQRHPGIWEEPERFDPLRFSTERSAGRAPLAWLPFGAGQRLCVGKEFALMEGQLLLARVLSRFDLEPLPGRPLKARMTSTLRVPDNFHLHLRRRSPGR